MAKLNDDAQWIILLGLIISVSIFFLALIVNEATLVGQTTAESVIDLPKADIQDLRNQVRHLVERDDFSDDISWDIQNISLYRKTALVSITTIGNITIQYNNGVLRFNETIATTS